MVKYSITYMYVHKERLSVIVYILVKKNQCNAGSHSEIHTCCDEMNPCKEGQGDCDNDADCLGNLKCGKNNCDRSKFPSSRTDCCKYSMLYVLLLVISFGSIRDKYKVVAIPCGNLL